MEAVNESEVAAGEELAADAAVEAVVAGETEDTKIDREGEEEEDEAGEELERKRSKEVDAKEEVEDAVDLAEDPHGETRKKERERGTTDR